jgi:glycosyltransferase involved in cell wall biosynthesis
MISLCTTCMNRRMHLEKTLAYNLAENAEKDVEFTICNYNSQDGLHEWVHDVYGDLLGTKIKYVRTEKPTKFNPSHAKNIAHKISTGDVLVNLDADNYASKKFVNEIRDLFYADGTDLAYPECIGNVGWGGRIAVKRSIFYAIKGYDETLNGWGWEDPDLKTRASEYSKKIVVLSPLWDSCIDHDDSIRALREGDSKKSANTANRNKVKENYANKIFIANLGRGWGELDPKEESGVFCT